MKLARVFMLIAVAVMALFSASPAIADDGPQKPPTAEPSKPPLPRSEVPQGVTRMQLEPQATVELNPPASSTPRVVPPLEPGFDGINTQTIDDPDSPLPESKVSFGKLLIAVGGAAALVVFFLLAIRAGLRRSDPTRVPPDARPFL